MENLRFRIILVCCSMWFCLTSYAGVSIEKTNGVVYILSIGINNYETIGLNLNFSNSKSDAIAFSNFIQNQSKDKKVVEFTLTNEQATLDSVESVINYINNNSKKEDYFFFYFGGFSWDFTVNSSDINFFLYDKAIIDVNENTTPDLKRTLSLSKLQSLLEFNKAKNQLLLSEAGSSADFRKIMQKSLINNDKNISAIIDRNRVVIAPRSTGYDNIFCDSVSQKMGPLMYFLTTGLSQDVKINVFNFFSEYIYDRNQAEFAIMEIEVKCDFFVKMYSGIYFEKDLMKDLEIGQEKPQEQQNSVNTQSTIHPKQNNTVSFTEKGRQQIKQSKALIVALDQYVKGSGWSKLYNPTQDADTIAELLRNNYNFEVEVLKNSSKDSILLALKRYANTLDSNDQFLFYFSGHGYFDTTFYHDGFFVMKDCANPSMDPTLEKYLPFNAVRSILDNLKSKQVMFMVDACFSGNVDEQIKAINTGKSTIDQTAVLTLLENLKPTPSFSQEELEALSNDYKNESTSKYISTILKRKTRVLIAAGSKKVPDGYKGLHSPMTALFIKLLEQNGGSKEFLTSYDIYSLICALPSKPVLGQLPQDQQGEFILRPKKKND